MKLAGHKSVEGVRTYKKLMKKYNKYFNNITDIYKNKLEYPLQEISSNSLNNNSSQTPIFKKLNREINKSWLIGVTDASHNLKKLKKGFSLLEVTDVFVDNFQQLLQMFALILNDPEIAEFIETEYKEEIDN
ncbi:hypothetical protein Glove_219g40 [Diversispora epigaea]|uniref:Uncharacterized protein n=1 Tax=Diversispora epigaea TaxID=1348612 RepID=A0A397IPC9_9GLOM|nr:hypothetical protein Glove_219g40 [Diversispora epigaea]